MSTVAIIGGGAAGMLAAIGAASIGHEVTIYEKNEKLGKKMYITGKGRCNITNASTMEEIMKNVTRNNRFLYSAFNAFSNEDIIRMLNEAGVPTKIERGNRVFPESDHSSDVISGLSRILKEYGVNIRLNSNVEDVMVKDGCVTGIKVDNRIYDAHSVIIATGGYSYQATGSNGDGYRFARKLGHTVTEINPSLVPFNSCDEYVKELQGLSLKNVKGTFYINGKEVYSDFGEMLFTHFGVSGPIVLSASSYLSDKFLDTNKIIMKIDLKPALSADELDTRILRDFNENINKDFRNSLNDLLPRKLIPVIIKLSKINEFKKVNEITKEERNNLVNVIKNFTVNIDSTRGFNEAIITRGGINVKEITPGTMESKIIKNLYFAGEVIDVDALTGGYNLQIAYSTGYLAGASVEY